MTFVRMIFSIKIFSRMTSNKMTFNQIKNNITAFMRLALK